MKFSVIMPVYNCEDTLSISIESLIHQTFPDWELLLVDDGSTDGSLSFCRSYSRKDPRIRVVHQENAGQGTARNKGIALAAGDYLVFCDSDDYYEKNALEKLAKAAENYADPDLIVGGYREFRFSKDSSVEYLRKVAGAESYLNHPDDIYHAYMPLIQKGLITSPWAKAYRRELIIGQHVRFPDLRRCQDVVFNLENYDHLHSLCIVSDTLYNYQTPGGDVYTRKFPVDMFDIDKSVYRQKLDRLKKWRVDDEASVRYCNSSYLKDISVLLRLNFQNQWRLDRKKRRELSRRMLHDPDTINACATVPDGIMNKIIRQVVKSQSMTIVSLFSLATLFYQRLFSR